MKPFVGSKRVSICSGAATGAGKCAGKQSAGSKKDEGKGKVTSKVPKDKERSFRCVVDLSAFASFTVHEKSNGVAVLTFDLCGPPRMVQQYAKDAQRFAQDAVKEGSEIMLRLKGATRMVVEAPSKEIHKWLQACIMSVVIS